jgi:hypothetical protein
MSREESNISHYKGKPLQKKKKKFNKKMTKLLIYKEMTRKSCTTKE